MGTIYVARHALTDGHGKKIVLSWTPGIYLNKEGREQTNKLSETLTPVNFTKIISSPIERAFETASIVAKSKGLNVVTDDHFAEWYMGIWTGRTFTEIKNDFPEDFKTWRTTPEKLRVEHAETLEAVSERTLEGLKTVAGKYREDTVLIVSHKDPIRAMLTKLLGTPVGFIKRLDIEMASVSRIRFNNGHFILDMLNYIPWKPF
ncbi:MAG: hypothetical protein DRP57_06340 [Spirochaetes bacterium]|nr:MAG: hypothetical protein DRP57_06340 [Spirochaetota bacterium]